MSLDPPRSYGFARHRLYGPDFLLVGPDKSHRLSELRFNLLLHLMGRAGQLVTKDELLEQVWAKDVEESNLPSQISAIRQCLGESAKAPVLIETIHGKGYSFRGRVFEIPYEAHTDPEVAAEPEPRDSEQRLPKVADAIALRGVSRIGFFQEFTETFDALFDRASSVTTFFIHSRRWRENHHHKLMAFLKDRQHTLNVFLPEPGDRTIRQTFLRNFDDGPQIPAFVDDACRYFARLKREHPRQVKLRFFSNYPTYSFYIFDDDVIFALYPTTAHRRSVPTLMAPLNSEIGGFVQEDVRLLTLESRAPLRDEINRYASGRFPRHDAGK